MLNCKHILLALMMASAGASMAQTMDLNHIGGGLETSKSNYHTKWVCTGDTLAVDTTANYGIVYQIDGFWITCEEITQEMWQFHMHYNPSKQQGPMLPVTNISRSEVDTFCQKISFHNEQWRLPTVEEFMFAYHGGIYTENYKFSGSNSPKFVAWSAENSDGRLHETGQLIPNELGLFDMSGNAAEMATKGDTICFLGGCYRDKFRKNKACSMANNPAPECQGFRVVRREPLWFNKYYERVYK